MKPEKLAAVFFAAVIVLGLAASVGAVDGTIEINQAKVLAASGFPYIISNPGSYRLTGNLTVPASTNGIDVTAPNVTIDLNGFSIVGPGATSGNGIHGTSAVALTVENGSVTGFSGISGDGGVRTGKNGIVRNVHATANLNGIETGSGSVISDNTANDNIDSGISCVGSGCVISGNTVLNNMDGIFASDATTGFGGNVLNNSNNAFSGGTSMKNNVCSGFGFVGGVVC